MRRYLIAAALVCWFTVADAQSETTPPAPETAPIAMSPYRPVALFLTMVRTTAFDVRLLNQLIAQYDVLGKDSGPEIEKLRSKEGHDLEAFKAAIAAAGDKASLVTALKSVRAAEIALIERYSADTEEKLGSALGSAKAELELVE